VFHTSSTTFTRTDDETVFSKEVMGYWTRFARTGDPNDAAAVAWPGYEEQTDEHLTLDLTIEAGSGLKKDKCDFWKTIPFPL
jgi:carboxylesterase type B